MTTNIQNYLRREQAAEYLKARYGAYSVQTLAKFATTGGGPIFRKLGKFPVYRIEDLDAWATERMTGPMASTSEAV